MSPKSNISSMPPRVAILLATYNGARYLREQLDSLFSQTYLDWQLYVGDDGSTDDTLAIVHEYMQKHQNMHLRVSQRPLRAMQNFMSLLADNSADYYFFCDQDDVWQPRKVEMSLRHIQEAEARWPGKPILVHTDLEVVDAQLSVLSPSLWHENYVRPNLLSQFNYLGVQPFVTGCTMVINNTLKSLSLPCPDEALMHDAWLAMQCTAHGGHIVSLTEATVRYRQHGNNTIGAVASRQHGWAQRLRGIRHLWNENRRLYAFASMFGYGSPLKYAFFKFVYHFRARHGQ